MNAAPGRSRATGERGAPSALALAVLLAMGGALAAGAAPPMPPAATDADAAPAARLVPGLAATGELHPSEVRDPFFRFAFRLIALDSLGTWSRADLTRYIAATGETTRLPLDYLVTIERRVAAGTERERRAGAVVERVWRIELTETLSLPMPYSILGYHPGSLLLAQEIWLSEWHLGDRLLEFTIDGKERSFDCAGLVTLRVDDGYIVLDADGWLDALLGKNLDDSWTTGFAVGRVNGRVVGVGLSVNRDGRKIYGELDFTRDEVMTHGRPPARALSYYCRPWTTPPDGGEDRAWRFGDSTDEQ